MDILNDNALRETCIVETKEKIAYHNVKGINSSFGIGCLNVNDL